MKTFLRHYKMSLTVAGSRPSNHRLHQLQMVLNYMRLGAWWSQHGFSFRNRVRDRDAVFSSVASQVGTDKVLYLEFGVYKGASMRFWSSTLKHPDARLHGFDSFEGLPEDFDVNGPHPKGHFNVQERVPDINVNRVSFFKGWFDQVLPNYSPPTHDVLIINMDADLYSSTIYVLRHLRSYIKPGTYIYFDDLSRPEHEPRAFDEFMKESGIRFRLICADQPLNNAFFQCIA